MVGEQSYTTSWDTIEEGQYFGEFAAIDGGGRSANVAALTDASVAMISAARFRELTINNSKISAALVRDLIARVRRLTERNYENIALPIKYRVQLELLRLAIRAGVLYRAVQRSVL